MPHLSVSTEENQAYQDIVANYLHYVQGGCDLALIATNERKKINPDIFTKAEKQQTPILIKTDKGKDKLEFGIYGDVGDGTWAYTDITGTSTAHLNELPFKKNRILRIKRTNPKFTEALINTLKKIHTEKSSISSRRNLLTHKAYDGKHAPRLAWEMLDINEFEYTNFISLIDCIAKIDRKPEKVFRDILRILRTTEGVYCAGELSECLFDYFIDLQATSHKDAGYYKEMPTLKHRIHHFVEELGIKKRIKKKPASNTEKHYSYRLIKGLTEIKKEEKNKTRKGKNWLEKIARGVASGNMFPDARTTLAGYFLVGLAIAGPFHILVGISGLYFGYRLAKNDLYQLLKNIYMGRFWQVKDSTTGTYRPLSGTQIFFVIFIGISAGFVAGACNAGLAYYGLQKYYAASLTLSTTITLMNLMTAGVFCLYAAAFFGTIKNIIGNLTEDQLTDYWHKLKSASTVHLILEPVKFFIIVAVMATVGVVGYFLFRDKCLDMVKEMFTGLSTAQAKTAAIVISCLYSFFKFIVGFIKLEHIIKETATNIENCVVSEKESAPELNRMQKMNQRTLALSLGCSSTLLMIRAGGTSAYYGRAASQELPEVPPVVAAATAGAFVAALNFVALKVNLFKTPSSALKPLPSLPTSPRPFRQ